MSSSDRGHSSHSEWLFSRETHLSEMQHSIRSWAWAFPFAVKEFAHYVRRRKQSPFDVLRDVVLRKDESLIEHGFEGLQFAGELALAHKMANGLRAAIINHNRDHTKKSVFGMDLTYAANHSEFPDHGVPHWRRMHRLMEVMAHAVPELRHSISIRRYLNAWMLFPHFHDIDQLLVLYQDKRENTKHDSKEGHATAAATMIMALTERYMQEAGMTEIDRANGRQITSAAALMKMKHNEPEKIEEAFSSTMYVNGQRTNVQKYRGTDKRYKGHHHTVNQYLLEDFEQNNVDLFYLSPNQVMRILTGQKKRAGLVTDDNHYGLYKPFYDEYQTELIKLYEDHTSLLGNLTEEERRSFILATEAVVIADETEMIYPPYPSILRSLKTSISTKRSWWKTDGLTSQEMYENIQTQEGNYKGKDFNCDVRRLLWEAWHSAQSDLHQTEEFTLKNSDFIRKTNKEHIIMRILSLKQFGRAMILCQQNEMIDNIYKQRIDGLSKKAMRRAGLNPDRYNINQIDVVALMTDVRADDDLVNRYSKRKIVLTKEIEDMKGIILRKPASDVGGASTSQFEELCDLVLKDICQTYKVDEKELKKIARKLDDDATAFYETYDSLGGLPDTLIEPENIELWRRLLSDMEEGEYEELRTEALANLQTPNSSPEAV